MQLFKRIVLAPEWITVVLLVIALVVGSQMSPLFLNLSYLLDKTSDVMPIGMLALAMTFVIITGQIDLSVASGSVLVMVLCAQLHAAIHLSMGLILPMGLLIGMGLGLFNGLLITKLKLPSLVVTLGTLAMYRGIAQVMIGETTVKGFPSWFLGIDYTKYFDMVPLPFAMFIIMAILAAVLLHLTTFGRRVYAIGTNEAATRFSAINTDRVSIVVFMMSGLCMGIAGLMKMSMLRTVDHMQFRGDELVAITAVVLGGTSINGGRGSILGTVLAMLLMVAVQSAMGMSNMLAENKLAVIGTLLIASVLLSDGFVKWTSRLFSPGKNSKKVGGTLHA